MDTFSSIPALLTKLTQKKVKFIQSDAFDGSFKKLKNKLTSALILTLPEGTNSFVVIYDLSLSDWAV